MSLLDRLKFWKKTRTPEAVPEIDPFFTVAMTPNGIQCWADWPQPESEEEAATMALQIGQVLFALNSGRLFEFMQEAVVVAGQDNGMQPVAREVLRWLHELEAERKRREGNDELVVPPTELFSDELDKRAGNK